MLANDSQAIVRQKVIKRKIVKRMGHEFVNNGQGALVLRCAHCTDLIYTATSSFCRSKSLVLGNM